MGERKAGWCHFCARADMAWMFGACANCTYLELLQNPDPIAGVMIQYREIRREIGAMLANVELWHRAPEVLHVSVAQFGDDFARALGCTAAFLSLTNAQTRELTAAAAHLDLKRSLWLRVLKRNHITRGKYDN